MLDGATGVAGHTTANLSLLTGPTRIDVPEFLIHIANDPERKREYLRLRRSEFVDRQGLFDRTDIDDIDDDDRTVILVAVDSEGVVVGGVRVSPCTMPDFGWWSGSRLVASPHAAAGVGPALVRAACAYVETRSVLRFDATVQDRYAPMFAALGWEDVGPGETIKGRSHRQMNWPVGTIQVQSDSTKSMLADALAPFGAAEHGLGPDGFRGDDGSPVPGTNVIAACDAILPSMVERDPEWAGWCSVLVNLNDLAAMGARPLGLLDAVAARSKSHLTRIIRGISSAADAWRLPVLGGHTQVGVHSSLAVTALGTTDRPIPGGGGKPGDTVSLLADLGGSWRPGYRGQQWDSTTSRSSTELMDMASVIRTMNPAAAKDVSMAGIVGTLGMLAEASGTGAELDVANVPHPKDADIGSWLTCFPGFAMLTADREARTSPIDSVVAEACGTLTADRGVRLRWPDGRTTTAIRSTVTGLGVAGS